MGSNFPEKMLIKFLLKASTFIKLRGLEYLKGKIGYILSISFLTKDNKLMSQGPYSQNDLTQILATQTFIAHMF